MQVVKYQDNSYFLVEGSNVYASLSPVLVPGEYVLYDTGGIKAVNELMASKTPELVYLFGFLQKMRHTAEITGRAGLFDEKESFIKQIHTYLRPYFIYHSNFIEQWKNDEESTKKLMDIMRKQNGDISFTKNGRLHKLDLSITELRRNDTLNTVGFVLCWGNGDKSRGFMFSQDTFVQIPDIVGNFLWREAVEMNDSSLDFF